jgi:acyl dehydratase
VIEAFTPAALADRIGQEVAVSEWVEVTQANIAQFAAATDDRYWIHLDHERAARESPYGSTIAHGFLTLSLLSRFANNALTFTGLRLAVNYGLNRVRFIAAVPAGSRLRARFSPVGVSRVDDGVQVTWQVLVEREGADKPSCAAEWIVRYYFEEKTTVG